MDELENKELQQELVSDIDPDYDAYEALIEEKTDELNQLLARKDRKGLRERLKEMNEFDIAEFLSDIDDNLMPTVFRLVPKETAAEVFANLEAPEQERIINAITDAELSGIIEELYVDDAVDIAQELPANVVKRIMRTAKPNTRKLINQYLSYPDSSAGSIMTSEYVDLKKSMTVGEALRRIRKTGDDKETIYICFVTSKDRTLEGIVTVKDLLLADDDVVVEDLMDTNIIFATTMEDQESVSEKFSDYDLMALPVVDMENRLVGIVTVDDIIDVMEQETTEDIEKMAGILPSDKPYDRTDVTEIWKKRIPWLMFLMLSATITSVILTKFEDRLATQAALIAFIPMLMGTGGNSGAQSATAVIRSLSLGDIETSDALKVLFKEWRVSLLCGLTLSAVNFVKMLLVDGMLLNNPAITWTIAATVSISILFVVMFAKIIGSMLPIAAEKVGLDPAVMANPLISTLTDATSLIIYIFVAKLILNL